MSGCPFVGPQFSRVGLLEHSGTLGIISTVSGSSWIPPVNAWLTDFCAAETCTGQQLSATVSIAADACSAELSRFGITKEFVIEQVTTYYPVAKAAVCIRDSNNRNDLCAITTLQSLQTTLGGAPLTPDVIASRFQVLLANNFLLAKQLACTECASAAFALLRPVLPLQFKATIDSFVGDQCGADFTSTPTGNLVVVTGTAALLAAQATQTLTSFAMPNIRSAMTTSSLVSMVAAIAALL